MRHELENIFTDWPLSFSIDLNDLCLFLHSPCVLVSSQNSVKCVFMMMELTCSTLMWDMRHVISHHHVSQVGGGAA